MKDSWSFILLVGDLSDLHCELCMQFNCNMNKFDWEIRWKKPQRSTSWWPSLMNFWTLLCVIVLLISPNKFKFLKFYKPVGLAHFTWLWSAIVHHIFVLWQDSFHHFSYFRNQNFLRPRFLMQKWDASLDLLTSSWGFVTCCTLTTSSPFSLESSWPIALPWWLVLWFGWWRLPEVHIFKTGCTGWPCGGWRGAWEAGAGSCGWGCTRKGNCGNHPFPFLFAAWLISSGLRFEWAPSATQSFTAAPRRWDSVSQGLESPEWWPSLLFSLQVQYLRCIVIAVVCLIYLINTCSHRVSIKIFKNAAC